MNLVHSSSSAEHGLERSMGFCRETPIFVGASHSLRHRYKFWKRRSEQAANYWPLRVPWAQVFYGWHQELSTNMYPAVAG